jgi:hypothetical protein
MTPEHVGRWVSQFPAEVQITILSETYSLLRETYISREEAKRWFRKLLWYEPLVGRAPRGSLRHISFLDVQRRGNSQRAMLELLDETMRETFGFGTADCGETPDAFVYLDDALYTGSHVRHDLAEWFDDKKPGTKLFLIFLAVHSEGKEYVTKQLDPLRMKNRVDVRFVHGMTFRHNRTSASHFDCLWPVDGDPDPDIERYIAECPDIGTQRLTRSRLFRPDLADASGRRFSSPEARRVLERALLRAGSSIWALPRFRAASIRPMGWEKLASLGFGATFVCFRNISNNCPVAWWWGDPSQPAWNPLSRWYPLFPRTVNQSRQDLAQWAPVEPEGFWPDDESWPDDEEWIP